LDSNVNEERERQAEKQRLRISLTDDGIKRDFNERQP
jgi:hypothetical protein